VTREFQKANTRERSVEICDLPTRGINDLNVNTSSNFVLDPDSNTSDLPALMTLMCHSDSNAISSLSEVLCSNQSASQEAKIDSFINVSQDSSNENALLKEVSCNSEFSQADDQNVRDISMLESVIEGFVSPVIKVVPSEDAANIFHEVYKDVAHNEITTSVMNALSFTNNNDGVDIDSHSLNSESSSFVNTSKSTMSVNSNVNPESILLRNGEMVDEVMCNAYGGNLWVTVFINDEKSHALIDTGSAITILKHSFGSKKEPSDLVVKTASGQPMKDVYKASVKLNLGQLKLKRNVFVCDELSGHILGLDILRDYGSILDLKQMRLNVGNDIIPLFSSLEVDMINHINSLPSLSTQTYQLPDIISSQLIKLPGEHHAEATSLFNEYAELFRTDIIGTSKTCTHKIELTDPIPIKQMPRRVSQAQYNIMCEQIEDMLKKGVIRPSHSPWASPVVLVSKKNGDYRFCVDYRKLNDKTVPDAFPLPHVQDILDALKGAKLFATLDLCSGYWQIKMHDSDIPKTSFVIPHGQYEYLKMSFGQRNASATFQRCMTELLRPLLYRGVLVFIDDITVYASTIPELLDRLSKVFKLIKEEGLTFNPKKCVFFEKEVVVLGHQVSPEGIKPLKDKVKAIEEWREPMNKKGVRSFLGTASYYRQYVPDFAKIAAPLHKLTGKSTKWQWTEREIEAFNRLKLVLQEAPVLKLFDPHKPIFIDCDASNYAIGSILVQPDNDGNEHPVAYFSRCLTRAECNYCVTRKELLAVLASLRHWRHYVMGARVIVRTDHSSLAWLKSFKNPEQQMARWLEEISQYDVVLQHRPGSKSGNADGLSRRPCPLNCTYCSRREAREEAVQVLNIRIEADINWESEQLKDEDLAEVVKWKNEGQKPPWEHVSGDSPTLKRLWREFDVLTMQDRILKRIFYKPVGVNYQIVVPRHTRAHVLETIHSQGHFGCLRTQLSLKDRFYWPGWKTDVRKCVNRCVPCCQRKGPHMKARLPPRKYLSSEAFERLGIDICGPFPITERGNKYLLVVSDYFTKWLEAIPIENQEAKTIVDALIRDVISRFGVPRELHSDQGANFTSRLMQNICDRLHIKKTRTCPYHPASNGQVERSNRVIADILSKIIEDVKDWDKLVPLACLFYRASEHKATGCSPALLALGRELRLPVDVVFPTGRIEKTSVPEYLEQLEERLIIASELARKKLQMDWQNRDSNSRFWKNFRPLNLNKPVYVFNPSVTRGRIPKLNSNWHGPFRILEALNSHLYKVATGKRNAIQVIHRSNLFQPEDIEDNEVMCISVSHYP
jgi:hypothetical protein